MKRRKFNEVDFQRACNHSMVKRVPSVRTRFMMLRIEIAFYRSILIHLHFRVTVVSSRSNGGWKLAYLEPVVTSKTSCWQPLVVNLLKSFLSSHRFFLLSLNELKLKFNIFNLQLKESILFYHLSSSLSLYLKY